MIAGCAIGVANGANRPGFPGYGPRSADREPENARRQAVQCEYRKTDICNSHGAADLGGTERYRRKAGSLHCTKIRVHHRHLQQGPAQILAGSAKNLGDSANYGRLRGPERVTSAKVDIWSTDDTRARERFSYWRDAVCRAVFNISIEAARWKTSSCCKTRPRVLRQHW